MAEELPERLRAGLGGLARADLEALMAEARAEARAEVKSALRNAYAKELLEQANGLFEQGERPRPATAEEPGDAWWVYCVVAADRDLPDGLSTVSARGGCRLVAAAGLAAVVSPVPLSEFGEAALRENLNDLRWLERTVRAHEAALEPMLAGGPLVPMRVCTIYRGEEQVRTMLEDGAMRFRAALAELAGKAEWGVKILADRGRLEEHVRAHSETARGLAGEAAARSEGGAYLARKKLDALVRDEAETTLTEIVRETHARLEEWASASVVLPAQNKELSGHDGEMVFNGAYLVEDDRADAIGGLLDDLGSRYAPAGVGFRLSGPWPAYNFAGGAAPAEVRQ